MKSSCPPPGHRDASAEQSWHYREACRPVTGGEEPRQKLRAKSERKRRRRAERLGGRTSADRTQVLIRVATEESSAAFGERLQLIRQAAEASLTDFVDSSPQVQAMLTTDPPQLRQVSDNMFLGDEEILRVHGLKALYDSKIERLRYRGFNRDQVVDWLRATVPHRVHDIMDLMDHGQRLIMQPGWRANGGEGVQNSRDYSTHKAVVEHAAAKQHGAGRSVLLRESRVDKDIVRELNFFPILTAIKANAPNRVCVHMSKGTPAYPAYNELVDKERHLAAYPRDPLPTLGDIANMLGRIRERFPDAGYLHAAVIDVASAYQQYFVSYEKFKVVWTKFQVVRDRLAVCLLQGYAVGTFGDMGGGDTWGNFRSVLDELHNAISELWASCTYVDDTVAAAAPCPTDLPPGRERHFYTTAGGTVAEPAPGCPPFCDGVEYAIHSAVIEHRENVARLFGRDATEDKKVTLYIGRLVALGWEFDLRYSEWCVFPKVEKLEKMAHWLFNVVGEDDVQTSLLTLQQLCGLLCWFSAGIPFGKSFVYSLFQCRRTKGGKVFLHQAAQRDLTFWRALIRMALESPLLVACPLQIIRTDRKPERFIVTDACTGTGGGGWLSSSPAWTGDGSCLFFILRWTGEEKKSIARNLAPIGTPQTDEEWSVIRQSMRFYGVASNADGGNLGGRLSINVLEFAAAVYAVTLFAPKLQERVVSIGTDNTACLCWLVRNKASSGAADSLLKLLSLVCTIYNIKLGAYHIPGALNFLSDWASRVTGVEEYDPHDCLRFVDTEDQMSFLETLQATAGEPGGRPGETRRRVCRAIISRLLVQEDELSIQLLIGLIATLHRCPEVGDEGDSKVRAVLDGAARALDEEGDHFPGIPMELNEAWEEFDPDGPYRVGP